MPPSIFARLTTKLPRYADLRRRRRQPAVKRRRLPLLEALENRRLLAPYVVTNIDDNGPGSLREAIFAVDNISGMTPGYDEIDFNIPGDGPYIIQLYSPLPAITNAVRIDGLSEGSSGHLMIELDGANATRADGTGSGLEFDVGTSDVSAVSGLVINQFAQEGILIDPLDQGPVQITDNFIGTDATGTVALGNGDDGILVETTRASAAIKKNVISGNANNGVELYGTGSVVDQNRIGTDATGTYALGNGSSGVEIGAGSGSNQITDNVTSGNGDNGVFVFGPGGNNLIQGNYIGADATGTASVGNIVGGLGIIGSPNNTIGGTAAGAGNVISGNVESGLVLDLPGTRGNLVEGNLIGTDSTGTFALGNSIDGVFVLNGASDNVIGGTVQGSRNIISGNGGRGVEIDLPQTTGNLLEGNYIGTDITGTVPLGNMDQGVILGNTAGNTIGGSEPGAGNLIAANAFNGIYIGNDGGNLVQGNWIGTNPSGELHLGNGQAGVVVVASPNNTIGGTTSGDGNVISGNSAAGVILAVAGTTGNLVQGNFIGTNPAGTGAIGNSGYGVWLLNGASDNLIGGTGAGAGNVIAYNGVNGVTVGASITDESAGNAILENSIYSNDNLGIDLGNESSPTGTPVGGSPAGPNDLQNAPVLTSALNNGSSTTISGTLSSAPNTTFRIEFFTNPAGASQGQTYLGFVNVATNGSGAAPFSFSPAAFVAAGINITATATDPNSNTSEFSAPATVQSNVTGDLSVKFGGFVFNRLTRQFSQTLTITNTSGAPITGPIKLVLLNLKNAMLANQTGTAQGNPYITVLDGGSLGAGQSFIVTLAFVDPTLAPITYTAEFLAGPIPPDSD